MALLGFTCAIVLTVLLGPTIAYSSSASVTPSCLVNIVGIESKFDGAAVNLQPYIKSKSNNIATSECVKPKEAFSFYIVYSIYWNLVYHKSILSNLASTLDMYIKCENSVTRKRLGEHVRLQVIFLRETISGYEKLYLSLLKSGGEESIAISKPIVDLALELDALLGAGFVELK